MKNDNFRITSQLPLCSNPLSMDTYSGCPHGCAYCFARAFVKVSNEANYIGNYEIAEPRKFSSVVNKSKTPGGARLIDKAMKARQPIHLGGMADPFPYKVEEKKRHSLEFIKEIGDYPCIWSTKNPIPEYAEYMKDGNHIMQFSFIGFGEKARAIEPNLPPIEKRLYNLKAYKGKVKKIIIRLQPFIPWLFTEEEDFERYFEAIKDIADGLVVEFLKQPMSDDFDSLSRILGVDIVEEYKKHDNIEGRDRMLNYATKAKYAKKIKEYAHKYGIEFYCGENEIREFGDYPNCCGISPADKEFQSFFKWNISELVFELREKGKLYRDDVINRLPDFFKEISVSELNWNAGNKRGYWESKRKTLQDLYEEYYKTKSTFNPAIMLKNVAIKKDSKGVFFEYIE